MITLSNTQISVARKCGRLYQYQYVNKRVPIAESHALYFGDAWHDALERLWIDGFEAAIQWLISQADRIAPKDVAMLAAMLEHYHPPLHRFDVQSVEQELTIPIVNPETGHPMRGMNLVLRTDALAIDKGTGELWLIEHKTTSDKIDGFGAYWQRLSIDSQISIYLIATGAVGVCYDVARKPGLKMCGKDEKEARAKGISVSDAYQKRLSDAIAEEPESYYQFREIRKSAADLEEAKFDIYQEALRIRDQRKRSLYPRNPDACRGLYGVCPYLEVCVGSALLEDETLFRDRSRR